MKRIIFCLLVLWQGVAFGKISPIPEKKCEHLLGVAETKQMDWIYEACGLNGGEKAFDKWGAFVSEKQYKKAMYQLCVLNPESSYAKLYCEKSAESGYIPAIVYKAQKEMDDGAPRVAFQTLLGAVDVMPAVPEKGRYTPEELAVFEAYEKLGFFYLQGVTVSADIEKAYRLLKQAADGGRPVSAHALGILMFWNPETRADSGAYWWKSILQGCPAAEENIGILNKWQEGKITEEEAQSEMEKRMFTCDATVILAEDPNIVLSECDCPSVLAWYRLQQEKPYLILEINGKAARLRDNKGNEEVVSQGEMTKGGYYVTEVRPNAVVLRLTATAERILLVYRQDRGCYDKCRRLMNQTIKTEAPVYQLTFTPQECEHLAYFLEELDNPDEPYTGLKECALPDWNKWGQKALEERRNKHLYILKNYRKSDYIPSFVSEAEYLFSQTGQEKMIDRILTNAANREPTDSLSMLKHEQAYCIKNYMHIDGAFKNPELAVAWAEAGAQRGYPQSMNMLGVLYALGFGVEQSSNKAMEWFLKADDASDKPFVEARFNYHLVSLGKDLSRLRYGSCKDIVQPREARPEEVLSLY